MNKRFVEVAGASGTNMNKGFVEVASSNILADCPASGTSGIKRFVKAVVFDNVVSTCPTTFSNSQVGVVGGGRRGRVRGDR